MRRVLILASWYPTAAEPTHGIFVEEQALALADRYQVIVVAPEGHRWLDRFAGAAPRLSQEKRRGVPVIRTRAIPLLPRIRRRRFSSLLDVTRAACELVASQWGKPDIIHSHVVLPAGWAASQIGHDWNVPVILTEHSNPFGMHLGHPLDRRLVQETLRSVDQVIGVSPTMATAIRTFAPDTNVAVIGNVIDTDFFSPLPSYRHGEAFRILSVGLLTPGKRMDRVIKAMADLRSKLDRPVELTIAGDGPERARLRERSMALGVADQVKMPGELSRERVRDLMRDCDVLVLASDSETFGVVLAEALACARPVVATRSGGAEWIVEQGQGILVPVGDDRALMTAIESIARGEADIDLARARESIETRFGRTAFVERLSRQYQEVWDRRATGSESQPGQAERS